MSIKSNASWTTEEVNKLASAVETFGGRNWARIAATVPGRTENQCKNKWWHVSRKATATATGVWTVEEVNKLVSAVETHGGRNWAEIAKMVPGRNDRQCRRKWKHMSEKTADIESAPKTNAALLAQASGLEVGPALHVFPRNSQQFLALLGITTGQSLRESHVEYLAASYVDWRCETVSLDDARASILDWKSRVGVDPAEPPSDETTTDAGYTSGDEPPGKRRRLDWI
jgi:hypothetical protein